ncbi:SDR family NAD(P)-dependent oxidoreductase [Anaerocolumna sp. AGMB13020]|uniref:SDR family NAD(P)-dependent oxidoreductase n=1 Tax=Anaerocolumna sp. AGMB13020 TaxID=3081750 RepID=UPI002952F869|nr:SDR family NAD(P)-dependent oxidoreductase [Anaerocolumna sp. AGMB13020]WOO35424.1 SDR family NAD(P)-dependent oxidoreductase [Anaerocolumna sp. AGMB13020]
MDFTDKVVFITGGAKGIGRSMAEHFQAAGAKTAIMDRLTANTSNPNPPDF